MGNALDVLWVGDIAYDDVAAGLRRELFKAISAPGNTND
jgi:hypothetical protein